MSCSSCTNSMSIPGAASDSFSRRSEMISSAFRLRCPRALQADEDVARVRLRREQAELGSGAPLDGRDLRRLEQDLFDLPQLTIGLLEGAARRCLVVDDKAAFVGLRQEAAADVEVQAPRRRLPAGAPR